MTRTRAGKKVDRLDARIAVLDRQRRALETQALGAEVGEADRRASYFAIADVARRRKLIALTRRIEELGREHRDATVVYWRIVTDETRAKLEDLRSDAPGSNWRRGIWWDVLTVFWILVGFGWLTFQVAGAIGGALAAGLWSRYIVTSRAASRVAFLRQGDDALRSSESQLGSAERDAAVETHELFSASEEATGTADSDVSRPAVTA
jgi:hypothetical protein